MNGKFVFLGAMLGLSMILNGLIFDRLEALDQHQAVFEQSHNDDLMPKGCTP